MLVPAPPAWTAITLDWHFNGDERIKYFHRVCTCWQVLVSVRERDKLERERQHVRIACKCERLQDSCTWQDSIFVAK